MKTKPDWVNTWWGKIVRVPAACVFIPVCVLVLLGFGVWSFLHDDW